MPKYVGPCQVCGAHVNRTIKANRALVCVSCAIDGQQEHCLALARHESPLIEKCKAAGQATADQIKARQGPMYEKWRQNMLKAMQGHMDP